jgi:hypothetical protein
MLLRNKEKLKGKDAKKEGQDKNMPENLNLIKMLNEKELSFNSVPIRNSIFGKPIKARIDSSFNKVSQIISELELAINNKDRVEIERSVSCLLTQLIDYSGSESPYTITSNRKMERETFVTLGGMRLLLNLIEVPLCESDARKIPPNTIQRKAEFWNELLVLLREVCYAVPSLGDIAFSTNHLVFFFTFLSHECVFENTMSLLEELIAIRADSFDLGVVPNLYSLIDHFTTRQLMHFCRILSLVLFESEDRQIMEYAHVLKSFDLLQLRRDRMGKQLNIIDRNQSLIIEMPNLLDKLLCLFRIINYGPDLSKLISHNIISQVIV